MWKKVPVISKHLCSARYLCIFTSPTFLIANHSLPHDGCLVSKVVSQCFCLHSYSSHFNFLLLHGPSSRLSKDDVDWCRQHGGRNCQKTSVRQGFTAKKDGCITDGQSQLTHVGGSGCTVMVDVGDKKVTDREACAQGKIFLGRQAFDEVRDNGIKKGNVMALSQVAGIMAAKRTSELIPLCHNVALSKVDVQFRLDEGELSVVVVGIVRCRSVTGVEMEALTAVSVALLTIYDMCKSVTKDMIIYDVMLLEKCGGVSGDYKRQ